MTLTNLLTNLNGSPTKCNNIEAPYYDNNSLQQTPNDTSSSTSTNNRNAILPANSNGNVNACSGTPLNSDDGDCVTGNGNVVPSSPTHHASATVAAGDDDSHGASPMSPTRKASVTIAATPQQSDDVDNGSDTAAKDTL